MKYYIIINGSKLKPTNGKPYQFDTYQDALTVVCMCYGEYKLGKSINIIKE
jgi:hypothetical protein